LRADSLMVFTAREKEAAEIARAERIPEERQS
jgi:hypothetical protein